MSVSPKAINSHEALELLQAPFVVYEAVKLAEEKADSLMTSNQKALFAQFDSLPFHQRLSNRSRFRQAILRNAIANELRKEAN